MSDQAYEMASESAQTNAVNQGTQEGQSAFESNTDANNSLPGRVLEGDELRTALIERLEHVLSKEYLASDPLLVSRLSADFYAPISIIEELPIIKSLTSDSKLINSALRASKLIVVDEARQAARPAIQLSQRNTIILRDIPENTTEQDVRALLAGTNFEASITELKPDFGNTFFIKFATEDVVTDAFAHLRKQTLGGKPVQARIKSEHLLKSVYYGSSNFQSSSTPSSPQFYQNNGIRPSYSNPSPRSGGRGFKSNDGSFRPTYDTSKRSPQSWTNNNSSNTRKKDYNRGGGGKPFDGKGARGRNGNPRKKGYGGRGLPTAPSHWPPLSGEENADASTQAQTAPVAGGPSGAQHDGSQPTVTTTTTTTTTTTNTTSQPEQQQDTQPKVDSNASATAQLNAGSGTSTPPAVATAWAVSNSAVKQPPPKRVPNAAPKKHKQQKQQPQASQPQQNQKSQNNSSGNSGGGKWKEARGGRKHKQGGRRGGQGERRNNSSHNNNSNTSNTVTNSSSNTAQATTVAPTTNDHKTDDASHAQPTTVQQPVTPSIGSDSQSAPSSQSPASGSKVSYADVVRPTSTPDQPKLKPEASANPPSD